MDNKTVGRFVGLGLLLLGFYLGFTGFAMSTANANAPAMMQAVEAKSSQWLIWLISGIACAGLGVALMMFNKRSSS